MTVFVQEVAQVQAKAMMLTDNQAKLVDALQMHTTSHNRFVNRLRAVLLAVLVVQAADSALSWWLRIRTAEPQVPGEGAGDAAAAETHAAGSIQWVFGWWPFSWRAA